MSARAEDGCSTSLLVSVWLSRAMEDVRSIVVRCSLCLVASVVAAVFGVFISERFGGNCCYIK